MAIFSIIVGTVLSRVIDDRVGVERITLTDNTPALRLASRDPGRSPIALLAHGASASKETLFRFAEALAAAGFDCYAFDQPGHGESRTPFSVDNMFQQQKSLAKSFQPVEVYLGHSMGAGAGAWNVQEAGFRPKLFIAVGNSVNLDTSETRLVVLAGKFEEFVRASQLEGLTTAQVVVSPWSDHCLEPFDPVLIKAGVDAACAALGRKPPAVSTAWLWRAAGLVLAMAGAFILMFSVPQFDPCVPIRGILVAGILIVTLIVTAQTWVAATPRLHRLPLQAILLAATYLSLVSVKKLRLPRWSIPIGTALLTITCFILSRGTHIAGFGVLMAALGLATVLLCAALIIGRIASRHGTQRDGNIAMAIFSSYATEQCMPMFF